MIALPRTVRTRHIATGVAALLYATTAAAHPDVDRLVAQSQQAQPPAFERTSRVQIEGKPNMLVVDRFDPRAAKGHQWKLVSIDGRAPTADDIAKHAKQNPEDNTPGFHQLHRQLGTPPRCTESAGGTLCTWKALPAGALKMPGPDFSKKLSAEVLLTEGKGVSRVRVFAAEPFSIMAVAKMHKLNVISTYVPGRNGQPFLSSQTIDVHVTAPFGKGAKTHSDVSFRPL